MKRIVVAGSRGFTDYTLLRENLDALLGETSGDVELISGHAAGADQLAERYAQERNIPITVMRPDWKTYGRAAGPVRNKQMLDYASEGSPLVIAFWDGKSKGTKNTIDTAQKMGISIKVVLY